MSWSLSLSGRLSGNTDLEISSARAAFTDTVRAFRGFGLSPTGQISINGVVINAADVPDTDDVYDVPPVGDRSTTTQGDRTGMPGSSTPI